MTKYATFLTCLATATVMLAADAPPPVLRLDGSVVPLRYRLDLTVDPASERFSGTMEIDVNITKPSPIIWLNGSGLNVTEVVVRSSTGSEYPAKAIGPGKDFVGLRWRSPYHPARQRCAFDTRPPSHGRVPRGCSQGKTQEIGTRTRNSNRSTLVPHFRVSMNPPIKRPGKSRYASLPT
jgi:hypothetical protein